MSPAGRWGMYLLWMTKTMLAPYCGHYTNLISVTNRTGTATDYNVGLWHQGSSDRDVHHAKNQSEVVAVGCGRSKALVKKRLQSIIRRCSLSDGSE